LLFFLVPSVNAFYWFLTALSTELYMMMYILMFLSALYLHYKYVDRPKVFKVPFGNAGMWTTCLLGIFGCASTITVSFFPPEMIDVGSVSRYAGMIALGNVISISPVLLFFWYKRMKARS
jgi:hypothetical protein